MGRVVTLLVNLLAIAALMVGGGVLLFNLAFSPAWTEWNAGVLPAHPIQWLLYAENSPLNQPRIVQTICLWARLDPLPKTARNVIVDSSGQLFTKSYRLTFEAPVADVMSWLQSSPGPSEVQPIVTAEQTRYVIRPRDAAIAEVTLSGQQMVTVTAAWSDSGSLP